MPSVVAARRMDLAYSVGFGLCFGYSDPRKKWCSGGIIFIQNIHLNVFLFTRIKIKMQISLFLEMILKIVMGSTES